MVEEQNIDMGGEVDEDEDKNDQKETVNMDKDMLENFNQIWTIFDKDSTGNIEFDGLGTVLRWLNFNPTEEELEHYKQKYDQRDDKIIKQSDVLKIVD